MALSVPTTLESLQKGTRLFLSKQSMSDIINLLISETKEKVEYKDIMKNYGSTLIEPDDGEQLSTGEIFKADQGYILLLRVTRDSITQEDLLLIARLSKLDQSVGNINGKKIFTNNFKKEDFKGFFLLDYEEFKSRRQVKKICNYIR